MRKFTSEEIDEKAQQLVKHRVLMAATWLMDALREYSENHSEDAIFDVDEYYSGGGEHCPECDSNNIISTCEYRSYNPDWDPEEKIDNEYICEECMKTFDEPDMPEILEYWFVDDGFADMLKEKGECVLDSWIPIWGRRCSGQAIYLDGVIREIAKDILQKWGV